MNCVAKSIKLKVKVSVSGMIESEPQINADDSDYAAEGEGQIWVGALIISVISDSMPGSLFIPETATTLEY